MTKKQQLNDLQISLETMHRINWLDKIEKLPHDVDKKILDQCSDIIDDFLENNDLLSIKGRPIANKQSNLPKKIRKPKSIISKAKSLKTKTKLSKKKLQSLDYNNLLSTNTYPGYPSAFPCFRSYGPIKCPKNKLPMPRDLWYRIVYSQALEQQFASGEAFSIQNSSISHMKSSSKRKYTDENKSMMNTVISSTSNKLVKFGDNQDQLETNDFCKEFEKLIWNANVNKGILSTQSDHVEMINRPKIHHGLSAEAILESKIDMNTKENMPIPSAPIESKLTIEKSDLSIQQSTKKSINADVPVELSVLFGHPLLNQLYEYYHLDDIPRLQLFKRLSRRLTHIQQTLKTMSSNDIETKLKYKRDALVRKRQTPVQSLTKDERIAMVELELNVYEYVQAFDEPSSKSFHITNTEELNNQQLSPIHSVIPSNDTVLLETTDIIGSQRSASTISTIRPSTALLSTVTQLSEQTDKLSSWNHPLETNLMNIFEQLTTVQKGQIHKQLARRYEHIHKKARQLNEIQLQTQIDSKSKALEQNRQIPHPNKAELLRLAELELSLFELRREQIERNHLENPN